MFMFVTETGVHNGKHMVKSRDSIQPLTPAKKAAAMNADYLAGEKWLFTKLSEDGFCVSAKGYLSIV